MKPTRWLPVILALLLATSKESTQATSIPIDLGPTGIFKGSNADVGPIGFSDLNGTALNGSLLSIDLFFTNSEFVRLFSNTITAFDVSLRLLTSGGGFPGLLAAPKAYLIAQDGSMIPGFSVVGRFDSPGGTGMGFFPLYADANGTPNPSLTFPLDFYGVHFDFTLPSDRAVTVTGGDFSLFGGGRNSQFAVGPDLPDSGSTWLLLLIGVTSLLAGIRRVI